MHVCMLWQHAAHAADTNVTISPARFCACSCIPCDSFLSAAQISMPQAGLVHVLQQHKLHARNAVLSSSTAAGYIVAFELHPGATLGDLQALVVQELQKQEHQVRPQPEASANSSALHINWLHRVQACLEYSHTATPGNSACATCHNRRQPPRQLPSTPHWLLHTGRQSCSDVL